MIKQRFALDDAATDELIEKATAAEHESVDLYHFTHALNRALDEEGRARIIEMMWQIVYADGRRDELEDNLLWRAADLLGVSPRERIELRRRIGGEDAEPGFRASDDMNAGHADHRRFGRHRRGAGAGLCRARSRARPGGAARGPAHGAGRRDRGRGPAAAGGAGGGSRTPRCRPPGSPRNWRRAGSSPNFVVNNAGFGLERRCRRAQTATNSSRMIDLNVRALTELSLTFVDSLARHRGGILNVASVAAFLPGPGMAVYYATKAYVLSFSEALHHELAGRGIRVTALCPGPVPTEFQARSGMELPMRRQASLELPAESRGADRL